MLRLINITDYYALSSRYFREKNLGKKYNDENLENVETYKKIIEESHVTDFEKYIIMVLESDKPLINDVINYIGIVDDPILYNLIECISMKVNDNKYILKISLYVFKKILNILLYTKQNKLSNVNDLCKKYEREMLIIAYKYFPKEFFSEFTIYDEITNGKFIKFKQYVDPTYKDNKNNVFFVTDLEILDTFIYNLYKSIEVDNGRKNFFIRKLITISFEIEINMNAYKELLGFMLDKSCATVSIIEIVNSIGKLFITCDLYTLHELFMRWNIETKYNTYSIAFAYWCLKNYKNIYSLIHIDDDDNLYTCLVNGNALSRRQ